MPQVTKEEVEYLKECSVILKTVLPFLQNSNSYEVTITFDEKNALPLVTIKKNVKCQT